ncbi:MAG: hypothetical protein IT210_20005 [Armatimonadetes bacterium]|nr:hypothetical protein [Armatimonadota bacterium]
MRSRTACPSRPAAYLLWKHGKADIRTEMEAFPEMDIMTIAGEPTPNYLESYPDSYSLPEVRVEQAKYREDNYQVVKRTFHTPAGSLSDRTKIPPAGREYGVSPNPIKTE